MRRALRWARSTGRWLLLINLRLEDPAPRAALLLHVTAVSTCNKKAPNPFDPLLLKMLNSTELTVCIHRTHLDQRGASAVHVTNTPALTSMLSNNDAARK